MYYLSKHNKSKLTDAGMTTFGGFGRSFFKVTGVITAIIGYVIFSHERDEKIKEMVRNDIHSKIYGSSANKSNPPDDSSPIQEAAKQPMVLQSEPDSNDASDRVKEFITLGKQGNAAAQVRLGLMYYRGEGVVQDYGQAVSWLRKAAEQGYADAQWRLGEMYHDGKGVVQDYAQAVSWLRKAAEQGNPDAQANLAVMYTDGIGVSKNEILAYMLYNLASVNNESYVPIRNFMASQLAPDQLAEAQKLAVNWQVGTSLPTTTKINRSNYTYKITNKKIIIFPAPN